MTLIDYSKEPRSDIAFIDMKSFYASVECVMLGLDPLKTSLCVMSHQDNCKGLILASSPTFKHIFHTRNVTRGYHLPFDPISRRFHAKNAEKMGLPTTKEYAAHIEEWAQKTLIVPPRMGLYIEKNLEIQSILLDYVSPKEYLPYSIDEGFIDATSSLNYFLPDKGLSRKEKLDRLSQEIQRKIYHQTGIYSTIGMSNSNPLLAKLALDNEAKQAPNMRANWSYEDVPSKVWNLKLTDFWGIGNRTARRLNSLGIYSIRQLAASNPDIIHQEFGILGLQLWFHAHGVDESNLAQPYKVKSQALSNSQVLPKDYHLKADVELVLREMAEQVAIRLRRQKKKARVVSIQIGYASAEQRRPLQAQMRVEPSQQTRVLQGYVLDLFRKHYVRASVRTIAVTYSDLVDQDLTLYSLFDDPEQVDKTEQLERTIDRLRERYGFLAVQPASVLSANSRSRQRSRLIGGHSAGGLDGLE